MKALLTPLGILFLMFGLAAGVEAILEILRRAVERLASTGVKAKITAGEP